MVATYTGGITLNEVHLNAGGVPVGKNLREFFAWLLVASLPVIAFSFFGTLVEADGTSSLTYRQSLFLALGIGTVLMWVFRLVPDFVPGLALILIVILMGLVPREIAFTGFYSDIFFLIFGIFILAGLLAETSWLQRLEYMLERRNASLASRFWAVMAAALLLTLVVPSPLGRSAMVQPLIRRFIGPSKPQTNSMLALVHIHATTLISTIILTGNPLNFVLIGMLDKQISDRFQWLGWLQATAVAGLILTIALVIAVAFAAKSATRAEPVEEKTTTPEPPKSQPLRDWFAIFMYGLLIAAIFTRPLHQVPLVWVVLFLALAVFLLSGISLSDIRSKFDWPTLVFVATVVAWGPMLSELGLSSWLSDQIPVLLRFYESSLYLGISVTIIGILVVRLFIPGAPAFVILATTMLPFAETIGMSPWVVGFIILTLCEGFILPYQHGVYSQTTTMLESDKLPYRMSIIIKFNVLFLAVRIAAIYASIPWWKALNLI